MGRRKQQELELQAAMHGIPMKRRRMPFPKPSTLDLDRQLQEGIMKGLPIKIVKKKR